MSSLSEFCGSLKNLLDITTSCTIPDITVALMNRAPTLSNCLVTRSCKNYTIPDSVTSIGDYIFYYCTSLTSVVIPSSVTSIGSHAFYNCASLKSVVIPSSVTSIGSSAFSVCTSLTSVVIPSSVTTIERYAFSGCTSLTSVVIPSSVTSIGDYAFYGCTIHFRFRCSESEVPSGYPWSASSYTAEYDYAGE